MRHKFYLTFIEPRSRREGDRRREYILNMLLLGTLSLALAATAVAVFNAVIMGHNYSGAPLLILFAVNSILVAIYGFSRLQFIQFAAYLFISFFFVLATYPTFVWGVQLPQAILVYGLVVVMAGMIISGRAAFVFALLSGLALYVQVMLQRAGIVQHDLSWAGHPGNLSDITVYTSTFLMIALVAWLSNSEVEKSFNRAKQSERALRKERNSLQVKVAERTRALEEAQVEKMLELNHFAEFGRISAALLHDLANPLTIVSLNLQQMGQKQQSNLVSQARKGVSHMEEYLAAARRQLQQQRDIVEFSVAEQVKQVTTLLITKARSNDVTITTELEPNMKLKGDIAQFHHIVANLVANAIDAYYNFETKNAKTIEVAAKKHAKKIHITVQDHGVGITAEAKEHLFEPFFTTKGQKRGTGLGLTIIKRAVEEEFGGTITVASKPGHGTRFTVELPIKE